jgi:chemotaxis protein CheD
MSIALVSGEQRRWSEIDKAWGITIGPGELYVTTTNEVIITVLGSCVSACIKDPIAGVAGMNHYMLPGDFRNDNGSSARYGVYAMEALVNEMIRLGARRHNMAVKLVGGGRMWADGTDIGAGNIAFAKSFLAEEGLALIGSDVGGNRPRRVHFRTAEGAVRVKALGEMTRDLDQRETSYRAQLKAPQAGNVELF